jgi:hypothetical protein
LDQNNRIRFELIYSFFYLFIYFSPTSSQLPSISWTPYDLTDVSKSKFIAIPSSNSGSVFPIDAFTDVQQNSKPALSLIAKSDNEESSTTTSSSVASSSSSSNVPIRYVSVELQAAPVEVQIRKVLSMRTTMTTTTTGDDEKQQQPLQQQHQQQQQHQLPSIYTKLLMLISLMWKAKSITDSERDILKQHALNADPRMVAALQGITICYNSSSFLSHSYDDFVVDKT